MVCPAQDFSSQCTRISWAAYLPFTLVGFILVITIWRRYLGLSHLERHMNSVWLGKARQALSVFKPFLPLDEALSYLPGRTDSEDSTSTQDKDKTTTFLFISGLSLLEALIWLALYTYTLTISGPHPTPYLILSLTWLYSTLRPFVCPQDTVMYDLVSLGVAHIIGAIFIIYGSMDDGSVLAFGAVINMLVALSFFLLVTWRPFALPKGGVHKDDVGKTVSPEDYTTLLEWITFMWIYPLVRKGSSTTLAEGDVFEISPTLQARPPGLQQILVDALKGYQIGVKSNAFSITVDVIGNLFSTLFEYLAPYFLKKLLDSIDSAKWLDGSTKSPDELAIDRRHAYIYAFLMFISTYLRAQSDLQRLWFSRLTATRIRVELMSAIYDKSLKRVYLTSDGKKQTANDDQQGEQPKAGAALGKIVNLMTADVNKVVTLAEMSFLLYSCPLEVIIAIIMLYNFLGVATFAGFLVLIVGIPVNMWLSKWTVSVFKDVSSARDKRMSVVNEVITSIKFIKFFAWESQWTDRVIASRDSEISKLIQGKIINAVFGIYWTIAPVTISIIAFWVYVALGNQLTAGTAFAALQLFSMVAPVMNWWPGVLVDALTAWVSLKRIAVFLDEDEVSSQVSSLPSHIRDNSQTESPGDGPSEERTLALQDATLKWSEVTSASIASPPKLSSQKGWLKSLFAWSRTTSNPETIQSSRSPSNMSDIDEPSPDFRLRDISVTFPPGKLTMVVGPTASGKSALLMALLGEMTLLSGALSLPKKSIRVNKDGTVVTQAISYAAQQPWIRHQSIKDNILFGYSYDEKRYNEVVESCALRLDFETLEDGDATEIGAKGVSLSGGQKARVALARAVYAPTKYLLLDDPLSAVDSHTARFLFDKLLRGPLLANRTVILVTHHVDLVQPAAHHLVKMLDGRIDAQGSIYDLKARGILDDIVHDENAEVQRQEEVAKSDDGGTPYKGDAGDDKVNKKPRQLVKEEHRAEGSVKLSVYHAYLHASSYWVWLFVILVIAVNQFLAVGIKLWINIWGSAYRQQSRFAIRSYAFGSTQQIPFDAPSQQFSGLLVGGGISSAANMNDQQRWPDASEHPLYYVGIYATLCFANAIATSLSSIAQYIGSVKASKILFKKLLFSVMRATFRFHDTTPAGRLLNRFGKDMETIDESLTESIQHVNMSIAGFIASVVVIAIVFPIFLVPALVIGFLYYQLSTGYLNTGRDLRRMEANSKSPIYSGFSELLDGIVTVRAFAKEQDLLDNFYKMLDLTNKMWYTFWMTNRWLLVNFDTLGAMTTFITCLLSISYLQGTAGLAGVCITSAMAFSMAVYWTCRFYTQLELDLNSVERVAEYLELPEEPPAVNEAHKPPAYWPSSQNDAPLLQVEDLEIKYSAELPSVLQGISFQLSAGERIGLLGRTGSGKSTLAMSLFRFVDPVNGKIVIDGIDITTIGIYDLRSRMTLIPQDATLFSGTIRDNLDSFGEYENNECLDVLYRAHLIRSSTDVSTVPSRDVSEPSSPRSESPSPATATSSTIVDTNKTAISLSTAVSAGGLNFSQGQRQLIAMARALLRRRVIVVMDEATSSIDFQTDEKIQKTVREEFQGALLLTGKQIHSFLQKDSIKSVLPVAHRLRTIIDYDRLIVLDNGKIVEFDTPYALIEKQDGVFRNMCLQSGTFTELYELARSAHQAAAK